MERDGHEKWMQNDSRHGGRALKMGAARGMVLCKPPNRVQTCARWPPTPANNTPKKLPEMPSPHSSCSKTSRKACEDQPARAARDIRTHKRDGSTTPPPCEARTRVPAMASNETGGAPANVAVGPAGRQWRPLVAAGRGAQGHQGRARGRAPSRRRGAAVRAPPCTESTTPELGATAACKNWLLEKKRLGPRENI